MQKLERMIVPANQAALYTEKYFLDWIYEQITFVLGCFSRG